MNSLFKIALTGLLVSISSLCFAYNTKLAQELTNPVAHLINVPLQFNYNTHMNSENTGHQTYMNFQPVIPLNLNANWTVISRTILPAVDQVKVTPVSGTQFGLGDTLQSFFFSPNSKGFIWGIGPAISIPTGTQTLLGSGKWELGPTAVLLKIAGPWTVGALGYQIWSVTGNNARAHQSIAFLQPFLAYTSQTAWTYSLNSETTYDWKAGALSVPINLLVSKLLTVGKTPISIGGGLRYWAHSTKSGPKDFGGRLIVTFLFPEA